MTSRALADLDWRSYPCALCGGERRGTVTCVDRFSVPLIVARCGECGHVYLDPRPADEDLPALYDEGYYTGDAEYRYVDDRAESRSAEIRANARLDRVEELAVPGRLVEVGCSFGALLAAARGRGWEVSGVDLSPVACRHLEGVGIPVVLGTLEEAGLPDSSCDVVYLAETVEHLPHPRATLRAAAAALRPGGIVVLGTANHASLARSVRGDRWGYYLPGHLQYFTAKSLARLLAEVGLPVVRRRFGDDRSVAAVRASRRALGLSAGPLQGLLERLKRLSLGSISLGAGMVLYGRKGA